MGALVVLGFLVALSLVALIFRIGARTVFGYGATVDIAVMLLLALLFHGTFAGMTVAIIAGLFFSGFIWLIRRQCGYRTLNLRTRTWDEVAPDPLKLPRITAAGVLKAAGLFTLAFVFSLTLMFAWAGSAIGPAGSLILAPGIIAAAAILAAFITWRLS